MWGGGAFRRKEKWEGGSKQAMAPTIQQPAGCSAYALASRPPTPALTPSPTHPAVAGSSRSCPTHSWSGWRSAATARTWSSRRLCTRRWQRSCRARPAAVAAAMGAARRRRPRGSCRVQAWRKSRAVHRALGISFSELEQGPWHFILRAWRQHCARTPSVSSTYSSPPCRTALGWMTSGVYIVSTPRVSTNHLLSSPSRDLHPWIPLSIPGSLRCLKCTRGCFSDTHIRISGPV